MESINVIFEQAWDVLIHTKNNIKSGAVAHHCNEFDEIYDEFTPVKVIRCNNSIIFKEGNERLFLALVKRILVKEVIVKINYFN